MSRTILHDAYEGLSRTHRTVLFWIGIAFIMLPLLRALVDILRDHDHSMVEVGIHIVFFLMGAFLVMPEKALELIAIMPIPAFLQRERRQGRNPNYRGPERRGREDV